MAKQEERVAEPEYIVVKGAREHNLSIEYLEIPKKQLVVFTGVSGSGKSSLAFDTLYAEGQRRYVESLSSYARQFLGQMEKPKVEHIRGLSPTIAIEQKTASSNPRSTVGTVTEIYDYLRVLYARAGEQRCHLCGGKVAARSAAEMVDELLTLPPRSRITLLAPKAEHRKGEVRGGKGRVAGGVRGGGAGGVRARPRRRDDRSTGRGPRPGEAQEAHHRDRGGPPGRRPRRARAPDRQRRDGGARRPRPDPRPGRGRGSSARVFRVARLPQVRGRPARAQPAAPVVQLAARHVRDLQRPGRAAGDRPGPHRAGAVAEHRRRGDRAVAPRHRGGRRVDASHRRGARPRVQDPARPAVVVADREAAADGPLRHGRPARHRAVVG